MFSSLLVRRPIQTLRCEVYPPKQVCSNFGRCSSMTCPSLHVIVSPHLLLTMRFLCNLEELSVLFVALFHIRLNVNPKLINSPMFTQSFSSESTTKLWSFRWRRLDRNKKFGNKNHVSGVRIPLYHRCLPIVFCRRLDSFSLHDPPFFGSPVAPTARVLPLPATLTQCRKTFGVYDALLGLIIGTILS